MKKRLRVLHVTPDDKFFDPVFEHWEVNENFINEAIFITKSRHYQFRFIKNTDEVNVLYNTKMVTERLSADDYDIIFFYSIRPNLYKYFRFIPQNKIVIWWMWGLDIYNPVKGLPPFINLDLYKPLTNEYNKRVNNNLKNKLYKLYCLLIKNIMRKQRLEMLQRIDYFQPVLKEEYSMMCANPNFRASEFYCKPSVNNVEKVELKRADGNILLGNSATVTNNHLDVLETVKKFRQDQQQIIMPLNYGNGKYKEWLSKYIDYPFVTPIYNYMPREEYFKMLDDCSYAVVGTIRQQAMGNIGYALRHGIKVFLYKDSVAYKSLKDSGYVVYAIEDMTVDSLLIPLTQEEVEQNLKADQKERERRLAVYEHCLTEFRRH
jgi:hypothetical protein